MTVEPWDQGEPSAVPELATEPPAGKRVLIVAAHADDETFGCGGLLAQHAQRGDDLLLAVLTKGDLGDPEGLYKQTDYVELRREEARQAGKALGVQEFRFFDYPDQMGRNARHLYSELRDDVQKLLDEFQPDLVYHPWLGEAHPDHWFLALAVLDVAKGAGEHVTFMGYEIWSVCIPDLVVDVGLVYDVKEAAMAKYVSQLRYYDYIPICHALDTYRTLYYPSARYCEAFVRCRGGKGMEAESAAESQELTSKRGKLSGWLRRFDPRSKP